MPVPDRGQLAGANTYGPLSDFLRGAIADEESRILSESMQQMVEEGEAVVHGLRLSRHRDHVAPLLMDMLTVLRDHRALVADLGLPWRGLYEHAGYLQALTQFRVRIGEWLLHIDPWDDQVGVTAEEFALLAWRTLGEGTLLVDVYEQCLRHELGSGDPDTGSAAVGEPARRREPQWWQRRR